MRYEVSWDVRAIDMAAGFLGDDPAGLDLVLDQVERLCVEPRPPEARAWGEVLLRLRVGRYRVTYSVDDAAEHIEIIRVGRVGAEDRNR
ncbi:type II toxin-antitoxin system RelE/ParE family toxin [Kineosporia sp. A_224]|uniref:type II toxin-antitoxin system RelE family toxin n=1 Tax=Kineosporia sp. A_224 TaxID=1962180 RepID=UPI000B4BCFC2|nr:type II toxin-antitoxin system RelE/ParE family toxin [Kineosporia sp. A_224]